MAIKHLLVACNMSCVLRHETVYLVRCLASGWSWKLYARDVETSVECLCMLDMLLSCTGQELDTCGFVIPVPVQKVPNI